MISITLARKPRLGTTVEMVGSLGTGGININGCRIPGDNFGFRTKNSLGSGIIYGKYQAFVSRGHPLGRFPANLIFERGQGFESDPDHSSQQFRWF